MIILFLVNYECSFFNMVEEALTPVPEQIPPVEPDPPRIAVVPGMMPEGIHRLLKAYPGHFRFQFPNAIEWNDGTVMTFDVKGINKDYLTLENCPDLEDQLLEAYPPGPPMPPELKGFDPGRIRYEPFFKKMYGGNQKEVEANLAPVTWLPSTSGRILYVSKVNAIDKKLQAISNELDKLPNDLKKFLHYSAGTYSWRMISGTGKLSPHSYGIAYDLNARYTNYWRWDYPYADDVETDIAYRNTVPYEIVEVFEKYGFVWGGKWYHYDTMHFEYRPELFPDDWEPVPVE